MSVSSVKMSSVKDIFIDDLTTLPVDEKSLKLYTLHPLKSLNPGVILDV